MATVREAAARARDRGQPTHELICLQVAAQWGDASMSAAGRESSPTSCPCRWPMPLPAMPNRWRPRTARVCSRHRTDYRALGDRATAADAAAQAAVAFSQSQQRRRRLYAAAIAQGLSDECGGLSTPALRSPTGHPLTERQREIVELAVAGMSNKDIAKRLYHVGAQRGGTPVSRMPARGRQFARGTGRHHPEGPGRRRLISLASRRKSPRVPGVLRTYASARAEKSCASKAFGEHPVQRVDVEVGGLDVDAQRRLGLEDVHVIAGRLDDHTEFEHAVADRRGLLDGRFEAVLSRTISTPRYSPMPCTVPMIGCLSCSACNLAFR